MSRYLFTSESVTEGHPDKMCDAISDAILDELMRQDPMSRVACETCTTTGMVLVMGEITTQGYVDIPKVVRDTVREIGYTRSKYGFDAETCSVLTAIDEQSPDIAQGVNDSQDDHSIGAGDQGMMFGYATDETPEYMPYPIMMAHKLCRQLAKVRKDGTIPYLRPDGKSQVTVEYDDGKPVRIDAVVLSAQHNPNVSQEELAADIRKHVFEKVLPADMVDEQTTYLVNPTGRFVVGGPQGDSGLTGRKSIVDTYGGMARHGGGAFSGKDCTKVAIGVANPVSISVDTFGTGKISDKKILELIKKHFDLRPAAIIESLDLRRPIYAATAAYGHFGRTDAGFPWEELDKVDEIKADLGAV